METKFKIGHLVTLANDKNVYKVVEIWTMGDVAYSSGVILKENKYGLSCFQNFVVKTVDESQISPVIAPGTEGEHVPAKEAPKAKKA